MRCENPQYLSSAGGLVPCRSCMPCKYDARQKKTGRIVLEAHEQDIMTFITMTYSDEFLPLEYTHEYTDGSTRWFSCLTGTLNHRHYQLYMKRLRDAVAPLKIRFFIAGEYGDDKARPHYHLCLWNYPKSEEWRLWPLWHDEKNHVPMCKEERFTIEHPKSIWDVSQYVAKYTVKKMTKPDDPRLAGAFPEFCRSSKGIGLSFVPTLVDALLSPSAVAYIEREEQIPPVIKLMGKDIVLDRYMKNKIYEGFYATEKHAYLADICRASAQKKFKEKMQDMRDDAQKVSPALQNAPLKKVYAGLYKQQILEQSKKIELFSTPKRKM